MSRLHYLSLPDTDAWDRTLQDVSAQVRPYHRYLKVAIDAARRSRPLLGWRDANERERAVFQARAEGRHQREHRCTKGAERRRDRGERPLPSGHWVVLEAPPWCPEESDDTFDLFLNAGDVYDLPLDRADRRRSLR